MTTLATNAGGVGPVAIDDTTVFWGQGGTIVSVPKAGGKVTVLLTVPSDPGRFRVDGTSLYWVDTNLPEVAKIPKTGGAKTTLFSGAVDYGLDVAGGTLYFQSSSVGGVVSLPIAGGTPTFLAPATDVRGISALSPAIFFTDMPPSMTGVVAQAPIGGGNRVTLATTAGGAVYTVAADATSVYYCGDAGVFKLAL